MGKQIDLKALLESKMGNIEPMEGSKTAIETANMSVPHNLMFDAESTEFKPENVYTGCVGIRPLSLEEAKEFDAKINDCVEQLFQEGVDYGVVPGCKSKFLFKAGSEKIINMLGLVARTEIIDKVENYEIGYFSYTCKTWLIDSSGTVRAEGIAICNSRENKYQKSNPYNIQNILVKICKKRSIIDATLSVGTLSNRFSQDEDLVETERGVAGKNIEELKPKALPTKPATKKQIAFLEKLMQEAGSTADAMNRYVQKHYEIDDYHKATALVVSELIEKYQSSKQQQS